jgi:hypothetical protein
MDTGYHGKPRHPAPSRRYDIFQTAFEKKVTEAQEEIKALERLSRVYEIVRLALERAALQNDVKIELRQHGIKCVIQLLPNDRKKIFDTILAEIGNELKALELHDGVPSRMALGYALDHDFYLSTLNAWVELKLEVPKEGTNYIRVVKRQVSIPATTHTAIKVCWIEEEPAPYGR